VLFVMGFDGDRIFVALVLDRQCLFRRSLLRRSFPVCASSVDPFRIRGVATNGVGTLALLLALRGANRVCISLGQFRATPRMVHGAFLIFDFGRVHVPRGFPALIHLLLIFHRHDLPITQRLERSASAPRCGTMVRSCRRHFLHSQEQIPPRMSFKIESRFRSLPLCAHKALGVLNGGNFKATLV